MDPACDQPAVVPEGGPNVGHTGVYGVYLVYVVLPSKSGGRRMSLLFYLGNSGVGA